MTHLDISGFKARLLIRVENAAYWRREKAQERPEDERNAATADTLDALHEELDAVPLDDPILCELFELETELHDDPDASGQLIEEESRYIGRYGGFDFGTADSGDFLRGLLNLYLIEKERNSTMFSEIVKKNAQMKEPTQVFLCHAKEDKATVMKYYQLLQDAGFKPWIDQEDLLGGQNWKQEIPRAIKSSNFTLVFLSKTSVSKIGYVQKEFKLALEVLDEMPERRVFIIPVKLEDCEVPDKFSDLQCVNLYEAGGFAKVVAALRTHDLTQPDSTTVDLIPPPDDESQLEDSGPALQVNQPDREEETSVQSSSEGGNDKSEEFRTNVNEGETKRDVSKLVERAVQTHQRNERERLKAEEEAQRKKENKERIVDSFKTIIAAAEETVEAFNRQSKYVKLKVNTDLFGVAGEVGLRLMIQLTRNSNGGVFIRVEPVYEEHYLDGQKIKAWGYARAPSKRGFNLVLVTRGTDDLYGYWRTLHVRHRVGPGYGEGAEPFPFELKELPLEIQLFNAAHVYITERRDFKPEFLDLLIEELL